MSKREKRAAQGLDLAESENTGEAMSLEALARTGYSLPLGDLDTGRIVARSTDIFAILPDPKQPRRQIPSVVRQQWNGESATVRDLFRSWVDLFAEEVSRDAQDIEAVIEAILEGEEISPAEVYQGDKPDPKRTWGVIGGSLMAVVNLAAEIRRDGLTNPITVHRIGNNYLIETGERRWLAFHLLHIVYPDSTAWAKIPAREVTQSSVWRQASENTARASLNAIGMARQLAMLLMDLIGNEYFATFDETMQLVSCDRAYYAQVADGNQWRIPPGKGEQLVNAMGIKNPVQLRQYRGLLRLPDEIWMLADDLNWEEGFIRTRILEFSPVESLQIAKARLLAEEAGYRVIGVGHTVTGVTVEDDVEGENNTPSQNENWQGNDETSTSDANQPTGEQPEISIGDWIKVDGAGETLFQVMRLEEDTDLGEILYCLRNDSMSGNAEVKVQLRDLILVHKAGTYEPPTGNASEGGSAKPLPEQWEKLLNWAYDWAARALNEPATLFSATNAGWEPERLNNLVQQGFLDAKQSNNQNRHAANYRISNAACVALGRPALEYSFGSKPNTLPPGADRPGFNGGQRQPVSGGEFHSGRASAGSTPPAQPDPAAIQKRIETNILKEVENIPKLIVSTVRRLEIEKITTADGKAALRTIIAEARDELTNILARLPAE